MTRQVTTSLAEFLLARIAEDEANIDVRSVPHAALVQLAPGVQVWHTYGATVPLDELHGAHGQWVVKTDPPRIHADCESKRRLVELAESLPSDTGDRILRLLAAPYSQRKDFRDEWRLDR